MMYVPDEAKAGWMMAMMNNYSMMGYGWFGFWNVWNLLLLVLLIGLIALVWLYVLRLWRDGQGARHKKSTWKAGKAKGRAESSHSISFRS